MIIYDGIIISYFVLLSKDFIKDSVVIFTFLGDKEIVVKNLAIAVLY
jgi:hypothetical protein